MHSLSVAGYEEGETITVPPGAHMSYYVTIGIPYRTVVKSTFEAKDVTGAKVSCPLYL